MEIRKVKRQYRTMLVGKHKAKWKLHPVYIFFVCYAVFVFRGGIHMTQHTPGGQRTSLGVSLHHLP